MSIQLHQTLTTPTAYIIVESGGEWSDKWTKNICVMLNKKSADEYRDELESNQVTFNSFCEYVEGLYDAWLGANPRPKYPEPPQLKPVPKWKSGLRKEEITQEMRDTRKNAEAENSEMCKIHYDECHHIDDEHIAPWLAIYDGLMEEHGFKARNNDYGYHSKYFPTQIESTFTVDEVSLMK